MIPVEEIYAFLLGLPGGRITMAAVVFSLSAVLLYYAAITLVALFKRLSAKTETTLDDIMADRVRRPLKLLSVLLAAFIAAGAAYPDSTIFGHPTFEVFRVLLMFCIIILLDSIADGVMVWYGKEIAPKTASRFDDEIFPLFRKIARVLIYVLGILIILSELGVEIAPLVAGLGIAGLAVALALQDTLGNFFAGVYMMADKPIKPNDYIKLDGTEVEGTVVEVGWRNTKILTLANNYIYVPNSKIAQSTITNFYSPDRSMGFVMDFSASYNDEPDKVVEALMEAAREVEKRTGKIVSTSVPPWARPDTFGESSINYKVGVRVLTYTDRFPVRGEMIKEVYKQFRARGITIPFPARTVYLKDSKGNDLGSVEVNLKKGRRGA